MKTITIKDEIWTTAGNIIKHYKITSDRIKKWRCQGLDYIHLDHKTFLYRVNDIEAFIEKTELNKKELQLKQKQFYIDPIIFN
jgi:hypothetical protein